MTVVAQAAAPRRVALLTDERRLAFRSLLLWWAVSRLVVIGAILVAEAVRWPRPSWYARNGAHTLALLGAWDGRWYRRVAHLGYLTLPKQQNDTAFFPLYPEVVHALERLGLPYTAAAILISNAGFLVGLFALYELTSFWLPQRLAVRAVVYAAVFPMSFVFTMEYPEGLVLAAMALAGAFAWRGRWLAAAVAAAAATLARPEGAFLLLPLAALVVRSWPRLATRERWRALAAVGAAPAALGGFVLYQWVVLHDPLAYSHAQAEWGRRFTADGVYRAVAELTHPPHGQLGWLLRDALACALYLTLLVVARAAGVPWSWVIAGALIVVLPLTSGSFNSDARFGLLALPVYCGLARLGERVAFHRAFLAASLLLLGLAAETVLEHWP
jgi:hypothetical protein